MEATIRKETDNGFGIEVYDNKDVRHKIGVLFDGEISGHEQDGYPDDPEKRTGDEERHMMQARKFARYHVYRERGYDTLEVKYNPDRILQAALVVGSLSSDEFETHFGDLYRQLKSHYTDQEPVVEFEDEIREEAFMVYAKEVYLGLDETTIAELGDEISSEDFESYLTDVGSLLEGKPMGSAGIVDQLDDLASEHGLNELNLSSEPAQWIDAAPTVYPKWRIGTEIHQDPAHQPDIDRDPDCRLEIVPYNPDSLDDLQEYVQQHLKCQIRDCFVNMGVTPPEPFQVQGPGADVFTMRYQHFDFLQPFHDPDATVDWKAV